MSDQSPKRSEDTTTPTIPTPDPSPQNKPSSPSLQFSQQEELQQNHENTQVIVGEETDSAAEDISQAEVLHNHSTDAASDTLSENTPNHGSPPVESPTSGEFAIEDEEEHMSEERITNHQIEEMNLIASPMNRVKLYHLNDSGLWDDMGTGHVCCEYVQSKGDLCLVMISEITAEEPVQTKILESKVSRDDIYQLQGDSLIVWSDSEKEIDMALSFQESEGCCQLWDEIRAVQGRRADSREIMARNKLQDNTLDEEGIPEEEEEVEEHGEEEEEEDHEDEFYANYMGGSYRSLELPEPTLDKVHDILNLISMNNMMMRSRISNTLSKRPSYIDKLFDIFDMSENLEDMETLHALYLIFKRIILLDESRIFDFLFSEKRFMRLMGVLEYDPELQHTRQRKANHRENLKRIVVYKKVIQFSDPKVESKIHQSFKINYLKDTILAKVLDDATFTTLNTLVHYNNLDIIKAIKDDRQFLEKLFTELKQECELIQQEIKTHEQTQPFEIGTPNGGIMTLSPQHQRRLDLVRLLQEYNGMLKTMQNFLKVSVYRTLLDHGLLHCLEWLLMDSSAAVRHASSDIVCSLVSFDPSIVRDFIMTQSKDNTRKRSRLLESIIHIITSEPELGIQDNIAETFKHLFDPEHLEREKKDDYLNIFYIAPPVSKTTSVTDIDERDSKPYVAWLAQPFDRFDYQNDDDEMHAKQKSLLHSNMLCQAFTRILDIFGHFVVNHGYRMKNFVIRSRLLLRVSNLLAISSLFKKDVSLATIRFIRVCISLQDSFYITSIVDHDVFRPIMHVWKENKDRYNLINSAIIELFEAIRNNNMKKLIRHAVEHYREEFGEVQYVDTFKMLIHKFDQMTSDPSEQMVATGADATPDRDTTHNLGAFMERQAFDEHEDLWFESDEGAAMEPASDELDSSLVGDDQLSISMTFPRVSGSNDKHDDDDDDDLFSIGDSSIKIRSVPVKKSSSSSTGGRPGTPIKARSTFTISINDAPEKEISPVASEESTRKRGISDESQVLFADDELAADEHKPEMKRRKVECADSVPDNITTDSNSAANFTEKTASIPQ